MDYPEIKREIVAVAFDPCGKELYPRGTCQSTRRFAVRKQHLGLYCGGPEVHQKLWPTGKLWESVELLREGGLLEHWGLQGAFPDRGRPAKTRRRGGWDLSNKRRAQIEIEIGRTGTKCLVCRNTWFRGERDSREALIWLRNADRRGLYKDAVDGIATMVPKPTAERPDWFSRLPDDPRLEIGWRFDDSRLRPDHLFNIEFLRAAKKCEGRKFTDEVQRFGVDAMAMPVCDKCNSGRGARLFETPDDVLQRWADYTFGGDVAAARIHPEFPIFSYLMHLAYETNLVVEVEAAMRQRKRRA